IKHAFIQEIIMTRSITEIKKLTKDYKEKHDFMIYLLHKINKKVYKHIWISRCKETSEGQEEELSKKDSRGDKENNENNGIVESLKEEDNNKKMKIEAKMNL
ncbi:6538_t:CDS:1, partial [Gigaspora margarita]